jgi:hypothetical protein
MPAKPIPSNVPSAALEAYASQEPWSADRPGTVVVACSDGRLQANIDEFLERHLSITHYDRLYAPGGPGALVPGTGDYLRAVQFQAELAFLVKEHEIEDVVLVFHGAGRGGPARAVCADYRRKYAHRSAEELNTCHEQDARSALQATGLRWLPRVRVRVFRAEVMSDASVRFVELFP